ncbi:hypothetical protein MTR67_022496 [Solanum verrucosum]|uniref:Uncharacterized protein n=1 Tax=Solanum verrucosum TaxID=315347 RepID=A0AAF0QZ20_SOLVR|nr:hypothetical protein MTR67_022496 [Solanum verrucosum]
MMKGQWRCVDEEQALWKKVIQFKYGQDSHQGTNLVTTTYGVSVWRSIAALWPTFSNNSCYKIGNGNKVPFWRDVWNGQETLMSTYPALFSLCSNAETTVADNWSPQGWKICFRKVEMVARMLQDVSSFIGI